MSYKAKSVFNLIVLFLVSSLTFDSTAQSSRPNIIYIMSDDMGYGDLSGYGRKDYTTPNLDKLASQGMKFVNAYSAAPVCTPTRVAFMTGRYPGKIPVGLKEPLTKTKSDSAVGLTDKFPSVGTMMREAGYETAIIGKWHLGFLPEHNPTKNGFDYFFGILAGAADYMSHKSGVVGERGHDLYENDRPVETQGYLTNLFTEKAVSFIQQQHNKPFFLTLTYNAPHWPWQGPMDKAYHDTADFRGHGSPNIYAAMMKSLDDGIGRIMKTLDDLNLSKNTIVIFTNDNGGERFSDNGGLSRSKLSLWEGGIRVPAFVRWPGRIKEGKTTNQVATTMDWTATILAAGGANPATEYPLDGIDMLPICTESHKAIDRTLYWKKYKGVKQKAIRDGNWKYLQDDKGEYLFDLSKDEGEKNDLKDTRKDIFEKLKNKYAEWEKTILPGE